MPTPLSLCLEDLSEAPGGPRYMTCVAIRGDQPGLGVDRDGQVVWRSARQLACELWISADDCLILLRPQQAPALRVERAGRSLDVPCGKPVVLLDQDAIHTPCRSFRVHVHGTTEHVAAPAPFVERRSSGVLAATFALGVAAMGCNKTDGGTRPVEVREAPPMVVPEPPPDGAVLSQFAAGEPEAGTDAGDGAVDAADAGAREAGDAGAPDGARDAGKKKVQPIEVRPHPPKPVSRDPGSTL
jgi:hypothetical protein